MSEEPQETPQTQPVVVETPEPTEPTNNDLTIKQMFINNKVNYQNALRNDLFRVTLTQVYKQLVEIEQNKKTNYSFVHVYTKDIFGENNIAPDHFIFTKNYNYIDIQCYKSVYILDLGFIDIFKIFKQHSKKNKLKKLPIPYVVVEIYKQKLKLYDNDREILDEVYTNLRNIDSFTDINNVEGHRIKIFKRQSKNYIHLIIFFDSLNYCSESETDTNPEYYFENHNIVQELSFTIIKPSLLSCFKFW